MPIENVKILAIDDNKDNLTIIKALINEAFPKAQTIFAKMIIRMMTYRKIFGKSSEFC